MTGLPKILALRLALRSRLSITFGTKAETWRQRLLTSSSPRWFRLVGSLLIGIWCLSIRASVARRTSPTGTRHSRLTYNVFVKRMRTTGTNIELLRKRLCHCKLDNHYGKLALAN